MSEELNTEQTSEPQGDNQQTSESSNQSSFRDGVKNSQPSEFLSSLPEELRGEPSLKNVKDINDLATQFLNAQKTIGKKYVGEPDTDSTEELMNYYKGIGMPETPEGYELEVTDDLKKIGFDDSMFKEMSHKAGLTKKQASNLLKVYSEKNKEVQASRFEESEKEFSKMSQDLFGGQEGWAKTSAEVQTWMANNLPPELKEAVVGLDNKSLLSVVYPIKKALDIMKAEGQPMSKSADSTIGEVESPIDIRKKMSDIYKNPDFRKDPRLQNQYRELTKKLASAESRQG
jgi:hypothetical protein